MRWFCIIFLGIVFSIDEESSIFLIGVLWVVYKFGGICVVIFEWIKNVVKIIVEDILK